MIDTVYKPPDINVNLFNEHFNDLLRKFSNERKKCIIMADFNIDLLKIDTHGQTTDFIHGMFASAFYPTISRPTRVTQQKASLIDNNYAWKYLISCNVKGYEPSHDSCINNSNLRFPTVTV